MTQAMQIFIRCIVCGDAPEMAVKIAYPDKRNQDVWAAKLLCNPRVLHAIDALTKGKVTPHARRIELLKIVEGQDTSPAVKVAALKEIARLETTEKDSPDKKMPPREDELLQEKLHILGRKAAS